MRELMAKRDDELQKTCKSLEAEYVASVTLAKKEMNMSHELKPTHSNEGVLKIRLYCVAIREKKEKIEIRKIILSQTTSFCLKVNFVNFLVSSSQFVLINVFRNCLYAIYSLKKKHSRRKKTSF